MSPYETSPSKHQKSSRGPVVRMPLCFGLKVDTASYFLPAFNKQYEYLESMNKRAPKLFPSIKKLELLCCVGITSSDYKLVPSQPADLLLGIFPAVELVLFTVRICRLVIEGKEEVTKIRGNTTA